MPRCYWQPAVGAVPRVTADRRLCWRRVRRTWHLVVGRGALADATMVSRAVRTGHGRARAAVLWGDEGARWSRGRHRGVPPAQQRRIHGGTGDLGCALLLAGGSRSHWSDYW